MFDNDDVNQQTALESIVQGRPCNKRLIRHRLARVPAVQVSDLAEQRVAPPDNHLLADLHGLPERTLRVAELLSTGASWGEVCSVLGISRWILDGERERLKSLYA